MGMVAKIQTAFRHFIGVSMPRPRKSSASSGQLSALIHPSAWKFARTEFSEVEHAFPAQKLMNSAVGQPLGEQFLRTLGPPVSFIS
jgi:hypothetical protein